jgi:hypothetical protein
VSGLRVEREPADPGVRSTRDAGARRPQAPCGRRVCRTRPPRASRMPFLTSLYLRRRRSNTSTDADHRSDNDGSRGISTRRDGVRSCASNRWGWPAPVLRLAQKKGGRTPHHDGAGFGCHGSPWDCVVTVAGQARSSPIRQRSLRGDAGPHYSAASCHLAGDGSGPAEPPTVRSPPHPGPFLNAGDRCRVHRGRGRRPTTPHTALRTVLPPVGCIRIPFGTDGLHPPRTLRGDRTPSG